MNSIDGENRYPVGAVLFHYEMLFIASALPLPGDTGTRASAGMTAL
jgi:hypothetical protein